MNHFGYLDKAQGTNSKGVSCKADYPFRGGSGTVKEKVRKNQNGQEMERDKPGKSELILYQTEDGRSRLEVRFEGKTVWLTQLQMAELFQTSVPNINMHLRNIFAERELLQEATIKDFLIVQQEGSRKVLEGCLLL